MPLTKDGFYKQIGNELGDNSYVLLAGGGHKKENELYVAYASNADAVDNYHANQLLEAFSNTGLTSSGNTITLGSFNVKVGGKSLGTNASGVKIINSNTLSNGKITSSDNVMSLSAMTSTINGITATNVGSTATIINSNDISGGGLASGNNKISISNIITKVNGVTASNDGTTATIIASNTLSGGGLTTNKNYISTSSIYSVVNGVTGAITSGLTVSIIKGVSINSFTQGNTSNLSIVLNVNGITAGATLTKLYANNTYLFDGKRPNELFTQFGKNGRITQITIGGETKEHTISYAYESDLSERTGKLNSPINITLQSTLYPGTYTYTGFDGSGNLVLKIPEELEQSIQTIEEVTAYALNDVRNQIIDIDLGSKFTEFSDAGSQNTRITIGTETKDLKIDADKLDGKHANELLESFSTSGLTSSGNTLTLSQINLTVGGKSLTTSLSGTKIINSNTLSGGALGSATNYMSRAPIYSVVNGITGAIANGSTVSIIHSNNISGGGLASGNNKISISQLISRVNGITGSNDGSTVTIISSNALSGGGLTTNENYISTSSIYSVVNGITGAITSGLTVSIIKGVSINSFTQGTTTSLKIELSVNGVTASETIDKLYAYSATNLGGTAPKDLFSEFVDGGSDQTQITIAGETKQLKIPYAYHSTYLGGKTLGGLFNSFTGGGLTSTGNTITQLNHYICVGGVTKYAGSSSVKIINGLSVYGLTSSSSTNLKIDLNINGVTTSKSLTNIYATDSTKLGGKTLGGLFTEFEKGDGNQTKITIGGTTKQYAISYSYESDYSNRAGKLNSPINITLQSTLYPGTYTYTGFDGSENLVLKVPEELEQSIQTIEEVTAYALNDLRNQIVDIDLNDNFTEFSNAGAQTTRITIGHATKELQIDADKVDGFNANELLGGFAGGALSSNGNTLTLSQTNIVVGGKTLSLDASNAQIINSLSVGGLTSTKNNNLSLSITINGKTSNAAGLTKLYAHDAANLGGTAPKDLFSEFVDGGSDQTQITIASETKKLKIPYAHRSTYLGGKTLGGLLTSFTGGGLTSDGNTITQLNHYVCVGGVTKSSGSSSVKIINGLSVYGLTSSSSTNLKIDLNINGVTTSKSLTNIYATDSTKLGGKTLGGLFTEFEKGDGNQTKITIGGTTKQYAISYSYESDYSNRAGKLNNPINVTLKSSLYSSFDGLSQNDYVVSSWAGNTNLVLQLPPSFENTVKTIEEVTAYALNDLRNQIVDLDLNTDFTEFSNAGNQNTRITVGNITKDLKIDADKIDGYEANTLLEAFSNTGLASSGNTITLGSFNIKVGGKSLGTNTSGVKIINSNTLSGGALGSSTNYMSRAPIYSVINGVTGAITAGSTVSIIHSNNISGGGLASGNNKISISQLISRVNGITGSNDGSTVTIIASNTLTGGTLGSSGNYMSRAPLYSVINGITGAITAGSTVSIITGLSIYSLTPGITVNLTLGLNINGVTTTKGITDLYARYADKFRSGVTVTLKSSLYPTFDGLSTNDSIITNWYGNTTLVLSLPPSLENSIKTIEEVTAYTLNDLRNQVLDVSNEINNVNNNIDHLTEFSGGAISSSNNVLTQANHYIVYGGRTLSAGGSTASIINSNDINGGGLVSGNNKISISKLISRVNGITGSNDGSTATIISSNALSGGALSSNGNYMSRAPLYSVVNGITGAITAGSTASIITGLSIYNLTSGITTNLAIYLNVNGITTAGSITSINADTLDGYDASSFIKQDDVIDTHGEGNVAVVLDNGNDLYAFYERGGTCNAYEVSQSATLTNGSLSSLGALTKLPSDVFNGVVGYSGASYSGSNFAVYDLTVPDAFYYGTTFFWSFGNNTWKPLKLRVLTLISGASSYTLMYSSDNVPAYGKCAIGSGATPVVKIRIVVSSFSRLATFGVKNYSSPGTATTFMSKCRNDYIYRHIIPGIGNTYDLGSSSLKYANIYATNFVGNASTSTRSKYLETWYTDDSQTYGDNYKLKAKWISNNVCKLTVPNNYTEVDRASYAESSNYANEAETLYGYHDDDFVHVWNNVKGVNFNIADDERVSGVYYQNTDGNANTNAPSDYGLLTDFNISAGHLQFFASSTFNEVKVRSYWWTKRSGGITYPSWNTLIHTGNINMSGGGITSSNNTLTRAAQFVVAGGTTLSLASSSASIITGLTIYSFVSTTQKNLSIGINVNGVTASAEITTLYAGAGSGNSVAPSSNISGFSGGGLSVNGNTLSQANHFIVTSDGNTFSAGASSVRIVTGLSIYSLTSSSSGDNLTIKLGINGVTTSKSIGTLYASATNISTTLQSKTNHSGYNPGSAGYKGSLNSTTISWVENSEYADESGYAHGAGIATSALYTTNLKVIGGVTGLNTDCTRNGIYYHNNGATGIPKTQYGNTTLFGNVFQISNKSNPSPGSSQHWIQQLDFIHDGDVWHRQRINNAAWTDWRRFFDSYGYVAMSSSTPNIVNNFYQEGVMTFDGDPANITDKPFNSANFTLLNVGAYAGIRTKQLAFDYASDSIKYRRRSDDSWSSWVEIITSANIGNYATGNGGTTYYAGTGISISSGATISLANVGSGNTSTQYKVVGVNTGSLNALKYRTEFYFTNSGAYHTSDANKKYDIRDILNEDVNRLFETNNGYIRHFKWKSTDEDAYGFIAQELQEYCPEAVDMNQEDKSLAVNYNVAFSKVIGAMFKKLKQQDIIIKGLENKLKEKEDS